MKKLNITIIIVSDSRTSATDKSGKVLKKYIIESGHNIAGISIVPDDLYHRSYQPCIDEGQDY